ncbi:hypothetical protein OIU76_011751 [Salix suchowensis]|nr:hypothetical protein OIU76_011751 [Salix suchowensis]
MSISEGTAEEEKRILSGMEGKLWLSLIAIAWANATLLKPIYIVKPRVNVSASGKGLALPPRIRSGDSE